MGIPDMNKSLYFVVLPEDGVWVAHGIQHNIVTHGESLIEIRDNIRLVIGAYLERCPEAIKTFPPAAPKYWTMLGEAVNANRNLDEYLDSSLDEGSYMLELLTA